MKCTLEIRKQKLKKLGMQFTFLETSFLIKTKFRLQLVEKKKNCSKYVWIKVVVEPGDPQLRGPCSSKGTLCDGISGCDMVPEKLHGNKLMVKGAMGKTGIMSD